MPTFQSVGVHPELRKRLVTEGTHNGEYQLVLTPQALLSRNPAALKLLNHDGTTTTARTLPLAKAEQLRHEVAMALITAAADDAESSCAHAKFPGTISAWNQWRKEKTRMAQAPVLLTRCQKLDEMMALPAEYNAVDHLSPRRRLGVPFGHITQFSGPPGTGKTQLALQIASAPGLDETMYICSGNPNPIRLWEIGNHNPTIMQRTKFAVATDEYQVLARLGEFEASIQNHVKQQQQPQENWKSILLVVDSCSECLSSENSDLVATIGQTIRRLTRQYMLATVLINGTVSNRGIQGATTDDQQQQQRSIKPALGRSWCAVADIHVWLEQEIHTTTNGGMIRCRLDSHSSKRTDNNSHVGRFSVTAQGIQDKSS